MRCMAQCAQITASLPTRVRNRAEMYALYGLSALITCSESVFIVTGSLPTEVRKHGEKSGSLHCYNPDVNVDDLF